MNVSFMLSLKMRLRHSSDNCLVSNKSMERYCELQNIARTIRVLRNAVIKPNACLELTKYANTTLTKDQLRNVKPTHENLQFVRLYGKKTSISTTTSRVIEIK